MSTASLNAQGSASKRNCFTDEEVDCFLTFEVNARYYEEGYNQMVADNARKDSIIDLQASEINDLKSNEKDLKTSLVRGDKMTANYKFDLLECNAKYSKTKSKQNIWTGVAIGSIGLNVGFGAILFFSLR